MSQMKILNICLQFLSHFEGFHLTLPRRYIWNIASGSEHLKKQQENEIGPTNTRDKPEGYCWFLPL